MLILDSAGEVGKPERLAVRRVVQTLWNRLLGTCGEREAARYLRDRGLKIVQSSYRTNHGEIDLVAVEGDVIVFVEIKTRRQGTPSEAVTLEKQRRLTLAALHFLRKHNLLEQRSRFDVVSILWPDLDQKPDIDHIRNAFKAVGHGQMFR